MVPGIHGIALSSSCWTHSVHCSCDKPLNLQLSSYTDPCMCCKGSSTATSYGSRMAGTLLWTRREGLPWQARG